MFKISYSLDFIALVVHSEITSIICITEKFKMIENAIPPHLISVYSLVKKNICFGHQKGQKS